MMYDPNGDADGDDEKYSDASHNSTDGGRRELAA